MKSRLVVRSFFFILNQIPHRHLEKIKGERLESNSWGEDSSEDEYDEESLLDGE
jgi:hypothetical protein